jgi:hypothetical protein
MVRDNNCDNDCTGIVCKGTMVGETTTPTVSLVSSIIRHKNNIIQNKDYTVNTELTI